MRIVCDLCVLSLSCIDQICVNRRLAGRPACHMGVALASRSAAAARQAPASVLGDGTASLVVLEGMQPSGL